MKLFVIIATVVAFTCAAPAVELTHPSPVNPNVLIAVKPEEKIVLITDPKEIAKFKREIKQPLYPTILPQEHEHHITKRDYESSHTKHDIAVPLVAKHYHPEESSNEKESHNDDKKESSENRTIEGYQNPQTLPLILKDIFPDTQQHKRDIPVPLVPKHHHPEESFKENQERDSSENNKGINSQSHYESQFGELSKTKDFTKQQKQETAIPLVSKPQSAEVIEPLKENKEIKPRNYQVSQLQTSHKENIVTTYGPKTQTLKIDQNDSQKEFQNELDNNKKDLIANSNEPSSVSIDSEDHKSNPLVKNRLVPVAELFARPHDN